MRAGRQLILWSVLTTSIVFTGVFSIGSHAFAQQVSDGDRGVSNDSNGAHRGRSDLDRNTPERDPRRWPNEPTCGALFCEPLPLPTDPLPNPCGAIPIPCNGSKDSKDPLEPHKPDYPDPNEPDPKPQPKPNPPPQPQPQPQEPYPGEGPTNKPHKGEDL